MINISDVIDAANKIASSGGVTNEFLGNRFFDEISISKSIAIKKKLEEFSLNALKNVFLGNGLRNATETNLLRKYTILDKDFLKKDGQSLPDHSVYLLLNNDIGSDLSRYVDLYTRNKNSIFIIWDWDSQHWQYMSCILASNSDFYLPASSENFFTLSHFNPHTFGPIFIGVNQWSRKFIIDHLPLLLKNRLNEPFGPHVQYPNYPRRSRAVATLNQTFPDIGFADNSYQNKSDLENLMDWGSRKIHWIIPVLGGLPTRAFNCLITGGVPILPSHLRNMPEALALNKERYFYDPIDLVNPVRLQDIAMTTFDNGGELGVLSRINSALESSHIDTKCEIILNSIEGEISRIRKDNYDFSMHPTYK